jgi:hypothetical protein
MKGRHESHDSMAKVRVNLSACHFFKMKRLILSCRNAGSVHEFGTPEYNALLPEGIRHAGSRAAIILDIIKVSTVRPSRCHFYFTLMHSSSCPPDMRLLCPVLRIQIAPWTTSSMGGKKGGHRPRV